MKFTALFGALCVSLALVGPVSAAAPNIAGTWSGQATQISRDKPFAVTMTVTAKGAQIEYPDSACSATLTRAGTSGDYIFYVEKITKGAYDATTKAGCIPGSISVQKIGDTLIWGWVGSYEGKPIVVYGTLSKTSAPVTPTAVKAKAKPAAAAPAAPAAPKT